MTTRSLHDGGRSVQTLETSTNDGDGGGTCGGGICCDGGSRDGGNDVEYGGIEGCAATMMMDGDAKVIKKEGAECHHAACLCACLTAGLTVFVKCFLWANGFFCWSFLMVCRVLCDGDDEIILV